MRLGFPHRLLMAQVYNTYKLELHHPDSMLNHTSFCRNLLLSLGLKQTEFIVGSNCIFLRSKYNQLLIKMTNPEKTFIVSSYTNLQRYTNSQKLWSYCRTWINLYSICMSIIIIYVYWFEYTWYKYIEISLFCSKTPNENEIFTCTRPATYKKFEHATGTGGRARSNLDIWKSKRKY